MAENITAALLRLRCLFVISRNSTFTYKGRVADARVHVRDGRHLSMFAGPLGLSWFEIPYEDMPNPERAMVVEWLMLRANIGLPAGRAWRHSAIVCCCYCRLRS